MTGDEKQSDEYPVSRRETLLTRSRPASTHYFGLTDSQAKVHSTLAPLVLNPSKENYIALLCADGKTLIEQVTIPAGQWLISSYGKIGDGKMNGATESYSQYE